MRVSGWITYDNKGRIVEKYEPFFSKGWDYEGRYDLPNCQKVMMYYDSLGRLIKTVNPDSSEKRTVYGKPVDLTKPETVYAEKTKISLHHRRRRSERSKSG